jgi:hypothetical protein
MKWPAATSNYMAWVTSSLAIELDNDVKKLIEGGTLVGDCAYVKKSYIAIPLKGFLGGHEDAYNFYLSQLRITIERALGVLVHRWAILRAPLVCPIAKVLPLVLSLICLSALTKTSKSAWVFQQKILLILLPLSKPLT